MIYLDHNATTPLHPRAFEAMVPYLRERWGNPSSPYRFGNEARAAVERARGRIAECVGCRPAELVFCSSGTESDNLALRGVAQALKSQRQPHRDDGDRAPRRAEHLQGAGERGLPGHLPAGEPGRRRRCRGADREPRAPRRFSSRSCTPTTRPAWSSRWRRSRPSRGSAASCSTPTRCSPRASCRDGSASSAPISSPSRGTSSTGPRGSPPCTSATARRSRPSRPGAHTSTAFAPGPRTSPASSGSRRRRRWPSRARRPRDNGCGPCAIGSKARSARRYGG